MTNLQIRSIFFALSFFCLCLFSCSTNIQPCSQPTEFPVHMHTSQVVGYDTNHIAIIRDTVMAKPVIGFVRNDTAYRYAFSSQPFSDFNMFLSTLSDSTSFFISPDSTLGYDTLTFYYSRQRQFISNSCGFGYYFNIQSIRTTHNYIDSILIENTNVTNNASTQNLRLYIR